MIRYLNLLHRIEFYMTCFVMILGNYGYASRTIWKYLHFPLLSVDDPLFWMFCQTMLSANISCSLLMRYARWSFWKHELSMQQKGRNNSILAFNMPFLKLAVASLFSSQLFFWNQFHSRNYEETSKHWLMMDVFFEIFCLVLLYMLQLKQ